MARQALCHRHHRGVGAAGGLPSRARVAQPQTARASRGGGRCAGMTNNTESASPTTVNAAATDRQHAGSDHRSGPIDWGDVVISACLLAVFIAAFLNAQQWQPIAALFPKMATGIGALLSAAFLLRA